MRPARETAVREGDAARRRAELRWELAAHHRAESARHRTDAALCAKAWGERGPLTEAAATTLGKLMGIAYRHADAAEAYERMDTPAGKVRS